MKMASEARLFIRIRSPKTRPTGGAGRVHRHHRDLPAREAADEAGQELITQTSISPPHRSR